MRFKLQSRHTWVSPASALSSIDAVRLDATRQASKVRLVIPYQPPSLSLSPDFQISTTLSAFLFNSKRLTRSVFSRLIAPLKLTSMECASACPVLAWLDGAPSVHRHGRDARVTGRDNALVLSHHTQCLAFQFKPTDSQPPWWLPLSRCHSRVPWTKVGIITIHVCCLDSAARECVFDRHTPERPPVPFCSHEHPHITTGEPAPLSGEPRYRRFNA